MYVSFSRSFLLYFITLRVDFAKRVETAHNGALNVLNVHLFTLMEAWDLHILTIKIDLIIVIFCYVSLKF